MKRKIKSKGLKEIETPVVKSVVVDSKRLVDIKSIDKLWGIKINEYKEKTIEEYEVKLNEMSGMDLQNHAFEKEISVNLDREMTINQLLQKYKYYTLSQNKTTNNVNVITNDMNEKLNEIFGGRL